jgi:hypothetical protein
MQLLITYAASFSEAVGPSSQDFINHMIPCEAHFL